MLNLLGTHYCHDQNIKISLDKHFLCTKCGEIIDYSDFIDEELELVKKTEETLAKKHNFKVLNHNIEFYGLCEKCQ